ncbi:MFS transporter [Fodinicola acaciae]|uniref:MFS transporter n=1 Tax=Fodinicola acaciae TaxID=2681555 RepID=UPI0013D2CBCD|nr:MFS transporter [Fodinicola acaciae]
MLQRTAAHRDANVLRWLGAYAASVTGDVIYFVTLSATAERLAGPAQAGLVIAAGALPRAVLMLAGGVLADRWGPRRMVISGDVVRCLTILLVAGLLLAAGSPLWLLYVLAVVFGVADALFMPAVGALPPRLTSSSQLGRVQGMRMLGVRFANAAGPMAAGVMLAFSGTPGTFAVAGLLFLVSLALLLFVRVGAAEPAPAASLWSDFREGLRYVRGRSGLLALVIVIALSELCFSGPIGVAFVLLTGERHDGPVVLAAMLSAFSIGAALSSVGVAVLNRVPSPRLSMTVSLLLTAFAVASIGVLPATAGIAVSGVLGLTSAVAAVVGYTLLQQTAEPRFLGRVTAMLTLLTLGLSPLIFPLAGLVTAAWGAGVFLACCGIVSLAAAAVAVAKVP